MEIKNHVSWLLEGDHVALGNWGKYYRTNTATGNFFIWRMTIITACCKEKMSSGYSFLFLGGKERKYNNLWWEQKSKLTLTTLGHADFTAFAKATRLAALTAVLVYSALIGCWADVVIVSWNKRRRKRDKKTRKEGREETWMWSERETHFVDKTQTYRRIPANSTRV